MTENESMRTIDNVAPSKIGVTARALMPGLSLVLRPPDPSDPDPSRLDTLMELAAQERVEVLESEAHVEASEAFQRTVGYTRLLVRLHEKKV